MLESIMCVMYDSTHMPLDPNGYRSWLLPPPPKRGATAKIEYIISSNRQLDG
jgi:hypothetical protein